MSDKVTQFLVDLGGDPSMQESFRADPDGVMDDAGLSAEEKETVKTMTGIVDGRIHIPDPEGRIHAPDPDEDEDE